MRVMRSMRTIKSCAFNGTSREKGFTLIELLLVLAVLSLLATIATSVTISRIHQSKESALKESLRVLRKAVDDHYADTGKYPKQLANLVEKRYIRSVPLDPMTESAETWELVHSKGSGQDGGIEDVHSGSTERSRDGDPYNEW